MNFQETGIPAIRTFLRGTNTRARSRGIVAFLAWTTRNYHVVIGNRCYRPRGRGAAREGLGKKEKGR
jgi:hypothetical protein